MTIEDRLDKIECMLTVLVDRQQVREWYTTQDPQWVLSHEELDRYRRNGLLPVRRPA
jgi:hypothetical protein